MLNSKMKFIPFDRNLIVHYVSEQKQHARSKLTQNLLRGNQLQYTITCTSSVCRIILQQTRNVNWPQLTTACRIVTLRMKMWIGCDGNYTLLPKYLPLCSSNGVQYQICSRWKHSTRTCKNHIAWKLRLNPHKRWIQAQESYQNVTNPQAFSTIMSQCSLWWSPVVCNLTCNLLL